MTNVERNPNKEEQHKWVWHCCPMFLQTKQIMFGDAEAPGSSPPHLVRSQLLDGLPQVSGQQGGHIVLTRAYLHIRPHTSALMYIYFWAATSLYVPVHLDTTCDQ